MAGEAATETDVQVAAVGDEAETVTDDPVAVADGIEEIGREKSV